jgi:hypothetical protein
MVLLVAGLVFPSFPQATEASAAKQALVKGTIQPLAGSVKVGTIHFIKHGKTPTTFSAPLKNNQFQARLQDGTYTAYQYYNQSKTEYTQLAYTFKVTNGKTATAQLKVPVKPVNIKGSLRIGTKKTVSGTMKVACQSCTVATTYTATVKKGSYQLSLPNGRYKVISIYNSSDKKSTQHTHSFEVKSGKAAGSMAITVNEENFIGSVTKGGKAIIRGWMEAKSAQSTKYINITNGKFSANLPEGTYTIQFIRDDEAWQNFYIAPLTVTIVNGKMTGPIAIDIPVDNATGTFTTSSGVLKSGSFYIFNVNDLKAPHYKFPIENGKFSAFLPDGHYIIKNIFDNQTGNSYMADFTFIIKDGKSVSGLLSILVPDNNVRGSIMIGEKPASQGIVTIVSNQGIFYNTSVVNGKFTIHLADGSYSIGQFKNSEFNRKLNIPFTVSQGKASLQNIEIKLQADNFFGKVEKNGQSIKSGSLEVAPEKGSPYLIPIEEYQFSTTLPEGNYQVISVRDYSIDAHYQGGFAFTISNSQPATAITVQLKADNVKITIQNKNNDILTGRLQIMGPTKQSYTVPINKYNSISLYLRDGDYKVVAYYPDKGQPIPLSSSFSVVNGLAIQGVIQVVIPDINLKVNVLKSGQPLEKGVLYVRFSNGVTHTFDIYNGKSSTILADGTYEITRVYDLLTQKSEVLNITFTVKGGLADLDPITINLHEDNVHGTIHIGNTPAKGGTLMLKKKDGLETYGLTVKDGIFSYYLPDGDYVMTYYIPSSGKSSKLGFEFQVQNGQPTTVLSIKLPAHNFIGQVKKGEEFIHSGGMIVYNEAASDYYSVKIVNGKYSEYLPDGRYTISSVYLDDKQMEQQEKIEFEVNAGIVSIDPTIQFSADNVKGSLLNEGVGETGRLGIWSETTKKMSYIPINNGLFSAYLADGSYKIISFMDSSYKYYDRFNITAFTVKDGKTDATVDIVIVKE